MPASNPLFKLIQEETERQQTTLNLIASENYPTHEVMEALATYPSPKYAEGRPGRRYYRGCTVVDKIEAYTIARAQELFGAHWVNVQPHSGSQANAAVMMALLKPGDTILTLGLASGGHLSHGSPLHYSGKWYKTYHYGLTEHYKIDYDDCQRKALEIKPRLIIGGASSYPFDWDYQRLRTIADEVGAYLQVDMAHIAGFIPHALLNNPLPHAHVVTTTTHKTLRGPRGGMILMGQEYELPSDAEHTRPRRLSQLLDRSVFPGIQGGPCTATIAAKGVAFEQAKRKQFASYAKAVQTHAALLAKTLTDLGYLMVGGGTETHMLLLDLTHKDFTGCDASLALEKAGIVTNHNLIPNDPRSAQTTSGLRLGTSACTARGLNEADIVQVAHWIDEVLKNQNNERHLSKMRANVTAFMQERKLHERWGFVDKEA